MVPTSASRGTLGDIGGRVEKNIIKMERRKKI